MDISFNELLRYCEGYTTGPEPVLYELERETHIKTLAPKMLCGPLQGRLLSFFSDMLQPKRVLEVGSFTGYSAICLARGLQPDGELHTIEGNEELAYIVRKYVQRAGLAERVHLHIGDAKGVIPSLPGPFCLVYLDGGKQDYGVFYDLVVPKLRVGGYLLADNVLWDGKAPKGAESKDEDARVLHAFNERVMADERMENLILPVRDGLLVARKC